MGWPKGRPRPITPEHADRRAFALAMREAGHTLKEIGEALGISRERVRQMVVGSKVRGKSSVLFGRARVDPIRVANALRTHPTIAAAAEALGLSEFTVGQVSVALGLGGGNARPTNAARRREELIAIVRELAAQLGETPRAIDVGHAINPGHKTDNSAQVTAIQQGNRYFGSYAALIRAADCEPRHRGGRSGLTRAPAIRVEGITHGTLHSYRKWRCRCDECRAARSEYARKEYVKRKNAVA